MFDSKLGPHFTIACTNPHIIVTDYCINSLKMWFIARFREMIGNCMDTFDLSSIENKECEIGLCIHTDAVGKAYKHTIVNGRVFTKKDKPYLQFHKSDTSHLLLFLGSGTKSGPRITEFIKDHLLPLICEIQENKLQLHWDNKIFLKISLVESQGTVLLSADNAGRLSLNAFKGVFFFSYDKTCTFCFCFLCIWLAFSLTNRARFV